MNYYIAAGVFCFISIACFLWRDYRITSRHNMAGNEEFKNYGSLLFARIFEFILWCGTWFFAFGTISFAFIGFYLSHYNIPAYHPHP